MMSPGHSSRLDQIGGLRADDENAGIRPRAFAGAQDARNHGYAGDGMQRFGNQRAHACARAGGKHDEANPFVLSR